MLTLQTSKAVPGMTLALAVHHPEKPGHELLKPGFTLDGVAIARLKELGVRHISIEYPPTAFLMRYSSPAILAEQSRLAGQVAEQIDRVAGALHAHFDFTEYLTGVRALVQKLVDDPAAAVFVHDVIDARSSLAGHAFNVGVLSLLMGLRLDGYLVANRPRISPRRAQCIENLGLGALLHDVGLIKLDPGVRERFERTADEADPEWQAHAALGYDMVKGRVPATAAAAVLHHHQRLDGSGFPKRPRGLGAPAPQRGSEIHIFARIVAVADVFDRLRNPPGLESRPLGSPEPGPAPTVRALRRTLEHVRAGRLDNVVFKALLTVVPAFAPGSVVTLTDARRCVVTAWDPMRPCSPTVCPLPPGMDAVLSGKRPAADAPPLGEPIDLRERADLKVASVDGQTVLGDLFEPLSPAEFDLRVQYPTPIVEAGEFDEYESLDPAAARHLRPAV